ncbi:uncharacterized protein LACBIDRAFT_300960 [Laccaria bicolor S238N-H82]|uniref:Predicted protein n=1 Tax=Laccaria bicolor (strain S238N-H82 / ATCC MYA-4686) TaxID=486041 RepID=B0CQZ9_LACBS|nr:uncharacterized protein LACBIDRAFT_300960 [Laccaria bicolor S238N-H82]EDR15729.1 predicted protein [Laccaria bicolor S238N-H82]|eukprot:XP_001873937.1 predicted protein [Laccaria bicolor S238N-H82]
MSFRRCWNPALLPAKIRFVWNRITFTRSTTIYFAFSVVHFLIQLSFQIKAFSINAQAAQFLTSIVVQGHAAGSSLPFLHGNTLRLCSWVPPNLNVDISSCPLVWNGTITSDTEDHVKDFIRTAAASTTTSLSTSHAFSANSSSTTFTNLLPGFTTSRRFVTTTIFVRPQPDQPYLPTLFENDNDNNEGFVKLSALQIESFQEGGQNKLDLVGTGDPGILDATCLLALNWPVSVLRNTKREDMVFIAFQFWLLGMSIVALLNESIPHIFASLLTHMLATGWATFQITHTATFRSEFNRVIAKGACKHITLLSHYWEARGQAEIPSLVMHVVALLVSCFLTWRLIKLFGWQTFKRVGASLTINRLYKIVLILSIAIQLSLFFMVVTVSLWIDQLLNSVIGDLADFQKLYKVSSFITLVLLVPWLMTGWFAVRRELRAPMFIFLLLSMLYLAGWGVMFFSTTFRWTFTTWRFFSVMASASVFLTLLSFVLGVVCRYNFGKGLLRYLNAHQSLLESDFPSSYAGSDVEKIAFPSNEKPVPTYSAAFTFVLPPDQISLSRDPRFFDPSADPSEFASKLAAPLPALTINSCNVHQSDARNSHQKSRSYGAYSSTDGGHSRNTSLASTHAKRWVIE